MGHKAEFKRYLNNHDYELTGEGGVVFTKPKIMLSGSYTHSVNGEDTQTDSNIIPDEGLIYILDFVFSGNATAGVTWHLALYSANHTPTNTLTAATFDSVCSEITTGYSEGVRPQWAPQNITADGIDNIGAEVDYNIVTGTSVSVSGAALLSNEVKGGTSGTLVSASKFANARTMYNGDVFRLAYTINSSSL
jgi:hypothetical protein